MKLKIMQGETQVHFDKHWFSNWSILLSRPWADNYVYITVPFLRKKFKAGECGSYVNDLWREEDMSRIDELLSGTLGVFKKKPQLYKKLVPLYWASPRPYDDLARTPWCLEGNPMKGCIIARRYAVWLERNGLVGYTKIQKCGRDPILIFDAKNEFKGLVMPMKGR